MKGVPMILSDPLEKAVSVARENSAGRGLNILHPQYLVEAILQCGSVNGKLRKLGVVPKELLTALQTEIGQRMNAIPTNKVEEGAEYAAFMFIAEKKAEKNGYIRVTTSCVFAAAMQIENGSVQRVFRRFGLTEKILNSMITHATEREHQLIPTIA